MRDSGGIEGNWRLVIAAGGWLLVGMLVLLGFLVACDQQGFTTGASRAFEQAVRPNTDVRGERLCADHGGYEGYHAPSYAGRWLLCADGTAFRTFGTGPSDRWVREFGSGDTR